MAWHPSAPAVSRAAPVIEPEPAASFPRELVVRLKVPPELVKAIRELKEAMIMALSVRQATSVRLQ